MTRKLGVILLSGGLDSTTAATQAVSEGYDLVAVTVHYGQLHSRELDAAATVAATLGVRQEVVDVSFFRELAWYSALTNPDRFAIPEGRSPEEMAADIPITYVPMRNTFLLSLASAYLESHVATGTGGRRRDTRLNRGGAVHRSERYRLQRIPRLPAGVLREPDRDTPPREQDRYPVWGPVRDSDSSPGDDEGRDRGVTQLRLAPRSIAPGSCYEGGSSPCGRCDSCLLRAKGFAEAGVADPALAVA